MKDVTAMTPRSGARLRTVCPTTRAGADAGRPADPGVAAGPRRPAQHASHQRKSTEMDPDLVQVIRAALAPGALEVGRTLDLVLGAAHVDLLLLLVNAGHGAGRQPDAPPGDPRSRIDDKVRGIHLVGMLVDLASSATEPSPLATTSSRSATRRPSSSPPSTSGCDQRRCKPGQRACEVRAVQGLMACSMNWPQERKPRRR